MFNNVYYYENFDLSSLSGIPMNLLICGICGGLIIGTLFSIFYKKYTASFFKKLISDGVFDVSRAITINELDIKGKWFIKSALKRSDKPLRKYVICANINEFEPRSEANRIKKFWYTKFLGVDVPQKLPMDKAKFYMPEENRTKAEVRFTDVKNPVGSFIFAAVVLIAAAVFMMYAVPELLKMVDNFITQIHPEDTGIL